MNKLPKRNRGLLFECCAVRVGELNELFYHATGLSPGPCAFVEGPRGVACRVARRPISTRNDTVRTPATRL